MPDCVKLPVSQFCSLLGSSHIPGLSFSSDVQQSQHSRRRLAPSAPGSPGGTNAALARPDKASGADTALLCSTFLLLKPKGSFCSTVLSVAAPSTRSSGIPGHAKLDVVSVCEPGRRVGTEAFSCLRMSTTWLTSSPLPYVRNGPPSGAGAIDTDDHAGGDNTLVHTGARSVALRLFELTRSTHV